MFHLVFYTNRFIPEKFAGYTRGPVILIRPGYRNDAGLLAHELVHVRQWYKNPAFGWFYRFSKRFRLNAEVEAYREQLKHSDNVSRDRDLFAQFIVEKYSLDISFAQARWLLEKP
jgi:hypothetical protein